MVFNQRGTFSDMAVDPLIWFGLFQRLFGWVFTRVPIGLTYSQKKGYLKHPAFGSSENEDPKRGSRLDSRFCSMAAWLFLVVDFYGKFESVLSGFMVSSFLLIWPRIFTAPPRLLHPSCRPGHRPIAHAAGLSWKRFSKMFPFWVAK